MLALASCAALSFTASGGLQPRFMTTSVRSIIAKEKEVKKSSVPGWDRAIPFGYNDAAKTTPEWDAIMSNGRFNNKGSRSEMGKQKAGKERNDFNLWSGQDDKRRTDPKTGEAQKTMWQDNLAALRTSLPKTSLKKFRGDA